MDLLNMKMIKEILVKWDQATLAGKIKKIEILWKNTHSREIEFNYSNETLLKTAAYIMKRMTAGRGIVHCEMPVGTTRGFQLWVNLKKEFKMIEPGLNDF